MSKIRLPNQKNLYKKLNNRLARYVGMVQAIYDSLNLEASKIAVDTEHTDSEFHFSDYPETKKRVDDLQTSFVRDISSVIFQGTSREWAESNTIQDLVADKVYNAYYRQRGDGKQQVYYQNNNDALKAFQQRKDRGMNLSAKLWKQSTQYKVELETAISTAIERGTDAITLSKKVSQYLNDFPSLQKDYTEKFGHASKARDCQYQSIRLARSEINMAYRKAENLRWQQMDFVVGFEIHLSNAHPKEDICDRLAGKYPNDFEWTGFHPNDMCYKTAILKDEDEFWDEDDNAPSRNEVTDVPDAFKEWVNENEERIRLAEKHGTLPYFLRDNKEYVDEIRKEHKEVVKERNSKPSLSMSGSTSNDDIKKGSNVESPNLPTATKQEIEEEAKANYSFAQRDFFDDFTRVTGIERGLSMPVELADRLNANPEFDPQIKEHSYNCASTSVAYVMREFGFDVKATGISSKHVNELMEGYIPWYSIWMNGANRAMTIKDISSINDWAIKKGVTTITPDMFLDFFDEQCQKVGTYITSLPWKVRIDAVTGEKKFDGHLAIIKRFEDGSLKYIDPQCDNLIGSSYEYRTLGWLCKELESDIMNIEIDRGVMMVSDKLLDWNFYDIVQPK